MATPRKGSGSFFWTPSHTENWPPLWFTRGHDEYRRKTVGVGGFWGAIFWAWPCRDPECDCVNEPNDPYAKDPDNPYWHYLEDDDL